MSDPRPQFMRTIRELARCYQALEGLAGSHIRTLGLTPPQFDIIATLGNTPGMNFKELGARTLITKGTLTGIVNRLETKGLVHRNVSSSDRRCQIVALTAAGQTVFAQTFPQHAAYLRAAFQNISVEQLEQMERTFQHLREQLETAHRHSRQRSSALAGRNNRPHRHTPSRKSTLHT